jgi:rhodanese-related sulfurtransferase
MKQVSAAELRDWMAENRDFLLIDVREAWEHELYNIGGTLLPFSELMQRMDEIPKGKDLVIYCERGIRSVVAIQRLEAAGYGRLHNLAGGMAAWRKGA